MGSHADGDSESSQSSKHWVTLPVVCPGLDSWVGLTEVNTHCRPMFCLLSNTVDL